MENDTNRSSPEDSAATESFGGQVKPTSSASATQTRLLGISLIILALLLAYLFLRLWPSGLSPDTKGDLPQEICLLASSMCFTVPMDVRLIMMVMVAGGLGSFIHTATSFGDFVGNEKLTSNWIWWYILKPFIGMVLAAIIYLVIRGGFLSGGSEAGRINVYGIAALAGMAGMFSKQATDKLSEVFDTLFKTAAGGGDSKRKDNLDNPIPVLTRIDPSSIEPTSQNMIVVLKGSGFVSSSVARINGGNRDTEFKDSTRLAAKLLTDDVAQEGQLDATVLNPPPGGGTSTSLKITVARMITAPSPISISSQGNDESHVDGCDVEITSVTTDEDLPASRGGVA